ncbi:hypothetical protein [Micromonospora sp. NPDC050495]|uniref:hypothetical protein n=1 Tax=Micromonospora sp. NPDC050495 TaxID=3154936 RepID=UPI003401323D
MPLPPHRAALRPVLLLLAPLLLVQPLWRLLPVAEADPPRLVNGVLVLPPAGWPEALAVAVIWSWAVTAGVAALAGLDRPLRRARRALPTVCLALAAAVVAVVAGMSLVALALPGDLLLVGALAALVAVPVAVLLVRLALVPAIAVLTGLHGTAAIRAAASTVGRHVVHAALLLLLGVALPAQLYGWLFRRPEELVTGHLGGAAVWVLRDVVLVAVAVTQSWTLLAAHRRFSVHEPGRTAAPPDRVPAEPPPRWRRAATRITVPLGVAALLLPGAGAGVLAESGVLADVNVLSWSASGRLVALGWPAGRPPVLVSQSTIHDCLDDRCGRSHPTELARLALEPSGTAVADDGTVWVLTQHQLERCDPARTCQRSDGILEVLRDSRSEALTPVPGGGVLVATATPVPQRAGGAPVQPGLVVDDEPGLDRPMIELGLLRCADARCERPTTAVLGRVPHSGGDLGSGELTIRIGGDDRAVIAFRPEGQAGTWVAWCATVRCDSGNVAPHGLPAPERPAGMPTDEALALLHLGDILHCLRPGGCASSEPVPTTARPGGGVYGLAVGWPAAEGIRIQVGTPAPTPPRLYLWSCPDVFCRRPARRIPLVPLPYESTVRVGRLPGEPWLLAAAPDGRVVAASAQPEQVVTVVP